MSFTVTPETTFEEFVEAHRDMVASAPDDERVRAWYERSVAQAVEYQKITSIPACPAWCDQPAGHDYDGVDAENVFGRYHSRHFAGGGGLMQDERNKANEVTLASPVIFADHSDDLTPVQARELAAGLLAAAELYDEISSPSGPQE